MRAGCADYRYFEKPERDDRLQIDRIFLVGVLPAPATARVQHFSRYTLSYREATLHGAQDFIQAPGSMQVQKAARVKQD